MEEKKIRRKGKSRQLEEKADKLDFEGKSLKCAIWHPEQMPPVG